jgi:hypothetical protein
VLNRIYIIVGMLAIVVLAGAFIAPRFIQWGDYRVRMEELASEVLNAPVSIRGEIDFTLLPQPRLAFTEVLVGNPDAPTAVVDAVEAEFSLMDFLRDNYTITRLLLRGPTLDFTVDESGFLGTGLNIESVAGVGLGEATIEDATLRLRDVRSQTAEAFDNVDGQLRLASFAGPVTFQGTAEHRARRYVIRFNSAAVDAQGNSRLSAGVSAEDGSFSLSTEGVLTPGMAPRYEGLLTYRQAPPVADAADEIQGDLVLESPVTASTDRIVLTGYTLQPDVNRAGTRLTGAVSIQLGTRLSFDAVVSGGVFSLPPRDASENTAALPYEAVRLLSELPAPLLPPLPGRIGIDLAEVGLRGFALRDVRVDASTDGQSWQVEQFIGQLPGDTEVRASGTLAEDGGRPEFTGSLQIDSDRLDALVALWRRPGDDNPLFNQPGQLQGRLMLAGDALGLNGATLTLGGQAHPVELRLGFGDEQRLDVVARFGSLGSTGSDLLAAMLPDLNAPGFGISFPYGSFALSADTAELAGIEGAGLKAEGQWGPERITVTQLAAGDFGGLGLSGSGVGAGTDQLSGELTISADSGEAPALLTAYELLAVPSGWRDALARGFPSDLSVMLSPADATGAQLLTINGEVAGADAGLRLGLDEGIGGLGTGNLALTATLDGSQLTQLLGLGEAPLFGSDEMMVSASLQGALASGFTGSITASAGDESISFAGDLNLGEGGTIQGAGTLDVTLANATGFAASAGVSGVALPAVSGSAGLRFEGARAWQITGIAAQSGGIAFSGDLSRSAGAGTSQISGGLTASSTSVEGLAGAVFGETALLPGAGAWPDGPFSIGADARPTRGSVSVSAQAMTLAGAPVLGPTSFEFAWDETRLRVARFAGQATTGMLTGDLSVCCSGPLVDKTVSGRLGLDNVPFNTIATPALAALMDGTIGGGMQFEGTGASIAEIVEVLAGEGNVSLRQLSIPRLGTEAFAAVSGLTDVLNLEPEAIEAVIAAAMAQGSFTADEVTGAFTLAGGVVRLSNMIVTGNDGQLAGDLNLALPRLGIDGSFVMTPADGGTSANIVSAENARITAGISGTLLAPETQIELSELVAAIVVRANELEVERLEVLRLEDAERQRLAAEERNRLIEQQRAAAEATRLAAEAAARLEDLERIEQNRQQWQQQPNPQSPPLTPSQADPVSQPAPIEPDEPVDLFPASPQVDTLPGQLFNQPLDLGMTPLATPIGR